MTAQTMEERAQAVLDANWLGRFTKPAPRLYPHQWSWDSAFIAIGNRHRRWDRAVLELETLFDAQWTNGMVPHIVFADNDPGYFPGGTYWRSEVSAHCPQGVSSSGICQPPVHATAVLAVYKANPSEGRRFVEAMVPKLVAWHDYLHEVRAVDSPLIEVWHPWASGRDNNPEWDPALDAVHVAPGTLAPYQRADVNHADPADRPSDAEYDRYLFLVEQLRNRGYDPDDRPELPFRVRDILMNTLLVRAEEDLATLLGIIGADGSERLARADRLWDAVDEHLWSPETGMYHSMNAVGGKLLPVRTSGSFLAMTARDLPEERLQPLLAAFERDFMAPVAGGGRVPLTIPVDEIGFDPIRYWRGPAWINMTWLIALGLERQGRSDLARELRAGALNLCENVGFYEYFDPKAATGHGSDDFSWSAALVLEWLRGDQIG
ncbi:MAG: trehalase family glycosidase [Actinomycetota bacterium]